MSKWKRHPLSAAWPDMPEPDLLKLFEDVKKNGIRESVVLLDGEVLDGWHRCQAGQTAKVAIPTREYDEAEEGDPRAFVESKNGHRRHMTESQKSIAIVRTWQWKPPHRPKKGDPGSPLSDSTITNNEMAQRAGVSKRSIQRAKVAESAGFGDEVLAGAISVKAAAEKANGRKPRKPRPERKPRPPKPDPMAKLRAENTELRAEVADLREKLATCTDELQSWIDSSPDTAVHQQELAKLHAYIRTVESQRNEHMARCAGFQRECKALKKRLGE